MLPHKNTIRRYYTYLHSSNLNTNNHHSGLSTKATSSSISYLSSPAKDSTIQRPLQDYVPDYASNSNQQPPGDSNSAQAAPGSALTVNSINPDVSTIPAADRAIQASASASINPTPSTTSTCPPSLNLLTTSSFFSTEVDHLSIEYHLCHHMPFHMRSPLHRSGVLWIRHGHDSTYWCENSVMARFLDVCILPAVMNCMGVILEYHPDIQSCRISDARRLSSPHSCVSDSSRSCLPTCAAEIRWCPLHNSGLSEVSSLISSATADPEHLNGGSVWKTLLQSVALLELEPSLFPWHCEKVVWIRAGCG